MSQSALSYRLSPFGQLWWGLAFAGFFVLAFFVTGSVLIPCIAVVAVCLAVYVVSDPVRSIFAFILINVALTLRPHGAQQGDAPTAFDLAMGVCLVGIMVYWVVRLRILENQTLSMSIGQLAIAIFMVWSVILTAYMLVFGNNVMFPAIRETLNLSPLIVLPFLYEKFIDPESDKQQRIFVILIVVGCVQVLWNVWRVKSSIGEAVYLWEVGRGNTDESFSAFLMLIGAAMLIHAKGWHRYSLAVALFALGWVGIAVCFSRTLYVASVAAIIILVALSGKGMYRKASSRIALAFGFMSLPLVPIYFVSRTIRLLMKSYLIRFLSTSHYKTDASLLNRFSEWRAIGHEIVQSPIIGWGFGSRFRYYQIIAHFHQISAYSHSSYLYIVYKVGVFAAISFFIAYFGFVYKGIILLRNRNIDDKNRGMLLAGVSYLLLTIIDSYTTPMLNSKTDMVWVAVIWGYILSLEAKKSVYV